MLSLLVGFVVGGVAGVVMYIRERKKNHLILIPLLGVAIGLILAMVMGIMVRHVPVEVVGEYPLKAFDGEVYVVQRETSGAYVINTGVEGFDSVFLIASSGLVFDSRAKPEVVVYSLGHVGYLKYFTFVPNGMRYYRIVVPDKNSVKKIP